MKIYKYNYFVLLAVVALSTLSCKKQLEVGNPNSPTIEGNINNEAGIVALAQGGIYINGFSNGDGWLGDSYFSLPLGYHELMADNVGADASNNQVTTIGQPDYIIVNGTKTTNPAPQISIIRAYNNRASTGADNNAIYYQWLNMYAMNSACNTILSLVDGISFTGDEVAKKATIKAWCYWWKGFAYSSIGTMYYSGLKIDEGLNNEYVSHDEIIANAQNYLSLAASTLPADGPDYQSILGQLIPSFCQVGNGGILTPDMWKRNINTLKARNILLNRLSPFVNDNPAAAITKSSTSAITSADWDEILSLTNNGVQEGDFIFTGRTTSANNFFSPAGGTAAALTSGNVTSSTFKISERFMQYFKTNDKRIANNFTQAAPYKNDYIYTTRWTMLDGGNNNGSFVYSNENPGEHEVVIAGSYEENELMKAEANIRKGSIATGLSLIGDVREYLGAGVTTPATGTLTEALKELVAERRVALIYRGLSFYDNRRWGWIYDIANGGGSYGNIVTRVDGSTGAVVIYNDVTINYNFLDYWDVPADESVLNPPSATSVEVKNPNF